jgi:hypothetical protein
MDRGVAMRALIAEIEATAAALGKAAGDDMVVIRDGLREGAKALADATEWVLTSHDPDAVMAVSVDYMMLTGYVCGWQMGRAALVAQRKLSAGEDPVFHEAKLVTARFYAEHVLPKAGALLRSILSGGASILALTEEQF